MNKNDSQHQQPQRVIHGHQPGDLIINTAAALLHSVLPWLGSKELMEAIAEYHQRKAQIEQNMASGMMPLLTRTDAAHLLSVSLSTINRYLKDGKLKEIKIGPRAVRVDPISLRALLQQ